MDFSGPTTEPEDPVLARLFPTAYPTTRRRPRSSAASPRAGCATARPPRRVAIIDGLEEAGLPPELTEDGLMIDLELDEPEAEAWMRSFTDLRLALATRLGVEEGDEEFWYSLPDEDPRAQIHDIYEWIGHLQETLGPGPQRRPTGSPTRHILGAFRGVSAQDRRSRCAVRRRPVSEPSIRPRHAAKSAEKVTGRRGVRPRPGRASRRRPGVKPAMLAPAT